MAVKTPRGVVHPPGAEDIFIRECETWINLGLHPHIAACHYVRELGGVPRVFSEYAAAGTLEEWIRFERLYAGDEKAALARILDLCIQFAWGLHYAHERGVIHQDVKPLNALMWDDGTLKVTDYGLAGARQKAGLTAMSRGMQTVMVSMGGMTPSHCSPEQAAGQILDRRTDVWSWAVSVLEMFQGGVTWQTGSLAAAALEVFLKHGGKEEGIPVMPSGVAHLLRRCFQQNPADRPRTLEECAKVLGAVYEAESGKPYRRAMPHGASDTPDALNNRGLSFIDMGKPDEAEKLFERALQLDKHHLAATYNRSLMQWRGAEITDTDLFTSLEEIRKENPDDARVECVLGWTRMENADVVQAQAHFESAIELGDHGEAERGLEEARRLSQRVTGNPRTFGGHEGGVHTAAFSPDGRYILTGSGDKGIRGFCPNSGDRKLRLWDVATGQCLRTFEGGARSVSLFSRRPLCHLWEKPLDPSDRPRTSSLWDVATGDCLRTFKGAYGCGQFLGLFSRRPFPLFRAGTKAVRLLDVATGKCLRTFQRGARSAVYSPDGRYVLSGHLPCSSCGTRPRVNACAHSRGVNMKKKSTPWRFLPTAASPSPGAATRRSGCGTWPQGNACAPSRDTRTVISVAFSPDGRFALSVSYDKKFRLWDVAHGAMPAHLRGNTRG